MAASIATRPTAAQWQDMDARVRFLDAEEIEFQVIYPSLGIIWEGELEDPMLADALVPSVQPLGIRIRRG